MKWKGKEEVEESRNEKEKGMKKEKKKNGTKERVGMMDKNERKKT